RRGWRASPCGAAAGRGPKARRPVPRPRAGPPPAAVTAAAPGGRAGRPRVAPRAAWSAGRGPGWRPGGPRAAAPRGNRSRPEGDRRTEESTRWTPFVTPQVPVDTPVDVTQLISLRENAIAKEPGSSYFRPRQCVSRLGLAIGGQTPSSLPRM